MKKLILLFIPMLLLSCIYAVWKRKVYYDA